jgi:hypothetical protein
MLCAVALGSCGKKDLPDEDFIDFASNIERQVMTYEDDVLIVNAFDYEEFEKRVLAGLDVPKKEKNRASDFIRERTNPATSILESVMNGADFRFVKFYRKDNEPHVIFRTYFDGGVSLEDWTLGVKNGQIRIYDAFLIVSGINWSDDCRQKLCNYLEIYTDEVVNINQLIEVNYLIINDDYAAADSLLYWVMPQMQNNLYARTMELNLASQSKSYEEVQMLVKEFAKTFPNEQRTSTFYLIQSSIRHGLPDETLNHIHNLIALIGDDPIHYLYQSWAYQQANASVYALQMLDSAIRYIPYVFDLYLNKLDVYYADSDYEACVKLLYQMDTLFESAGEEDIAFFRTNYSKLAGYKPFIEWLQSKEKGGKVVGK